MLVVVDELGYERVMAFPLPPSWNAHEMGNKLSLQEMAVAGVNPSQTATSRLKMDLLTHGWKAEAVASAISGKYIAAKRGTIIGRSGTSRGCMAQFGKLGVHADSEPTSNQYVDTWWKAMTASPSWLCNPYERPTTLVMSTNVANLHQITATFIADLWRTIGGDRMPAFRRFNLENWIGSDLSVLETRAQKVGVVVLYGGVYAMEDVPRAVGVIKAISEMTKAMVLYECLLTPGMNDEDIANTAHVTGIDTVLKFGGKV